jgi:hypothetical protein
MSPCSGVGEDFGPHPIGALRVNVAGNMVGDGNSRQ